jgi:anti-anti-sigma regulatory factor
MLKITETYSDENTVTLKLDGKMVGALVSDLEKLCLHHRNEEGKTIILDFSGVTFIDNYGLSMLKKIKDNRVTMVNYSLFIETLLDVNKLISSNSE